MMKCILELVLKIQVFYLLASAHFSLRCFYMVCRDVSVGSNCTGLRYG